MSHLINTNDIVTDVVPLSSLHIVSSNNFAMSIIAGFVAKSICLSILSILEMSELHIQHIQRIKTSNSPHRSARHSILYDVNQLALNIFSEWNYAVVYLLWEMT